MEITNIDSFLKYYDSVRKRTTRVVESVPPNRIDWTPKPGFFTFGDAIRHIAAIERYMFAENAQRNPSRYPGHGPELADGYDDVIAFLDRMHAESMAIFNALSEADLESKCVTPAGTPITVWKWLRAMIEHEVHHRAQIYMMLGMIGVPTPPLYGLTSEEVRARSV